MPRTVAIGVQDFGKIIKNHSFYIDKTNFIKEWWENHDDVTLLTRPRRFGKTLTMSMVDYFFSVKYAKESGLFEHLNIWNEETYKKMHGSYPVLFISFAEVKETSYIQTRKKICYIIKELYQQYDFLLENDLLSEAEKMEFQNISPDMEDYVASGSIKALCKYISRYYHKKVILLLDEYDTPMQEAYRHGFWRKLVSFIRGIFNAAFKTNPYLERAIMTGITRVSKESVFSDLNNLEVVTTTSQKYKDCFGFTQDEVSAALDEFGLSENRQMDEQIVYDQLDEDEQAVWSFLLAGGYLKVKQFLPYMSDFGEWREEYHLELTNFEVKVMFHNMIRKWFQGASRGYPDFIKALLSGDLGAMNTYMNRVALSSFSYFDTGRHASVAEPERFYHGFVLGLLVELADRYVLTSNRESGFGRYDVMLEPRNREEDGIILEFKVQDHRIEKELSDTAKSALQQIEQKKYAQALIEKGISEKSIRKYGFAFCGKKVLIDGN